MAEFTDEQKRFVVKCWACDLQAGEIADRFVEHFGASEKPLTAQLARYNPEYAAGATLSKDLLNFFRRERKAFRSDLSTIPIAHRAYRVRELLTLYQRQKKKSDVIAAELLKQAAQEMGKMFERPEPTTSVADVDAYVTNMATQLRAVVERVVTNPAEVDKVNDEVKKILASEGL